MEHFIEQPFPMSWSEMGSLSKGPWGFNASNSGFASSMDVLSTSPQLNNPVMVASMPDSSAELQDSMHHAQGDAAAPYPYDDAMTSSAIPPRLSPDTPFSSTVGFSAGLSPVTNFRSHKELQEAPQLRRMSEGVMNSAGGQSNCLVANPSVSQAFTAVSQSPGLGIPSRDGTASSLHNQSTSRAATTWCQSYLNGAHTLDGMKRKTEVLEGMAGDAGRMGNLCQDEATARGGTQDGLYGSSLAGAQAGQSQLGQAASQLAQQQMQGSQGVFMPIYGTHTGVAQPQGAAAVVAGTARPRVRARRGQATDPHSIAERLRRERIAERMKALQELVPNSNKTDKASMLDEIIEYVKFLQLQVKVLSMSRLGGAGTVAPLIADLPVEDGMVLAERQVARLMEEDMGSAMQFLQAKGLCLMPVSLANVISATSARSVAVQQGLGAVSQSPLNASSTTTVGGASSSNIMSAATSSCAGGDGDSLTHG